MKPPKRLSMNKHETIEDMLERLVWNRCCDKWEKYLMNKRVTICDDCKKKIKFAIVHFKGLRICNKCAVSRIEIEKE